VLAQPQVRASVPVAVGQAVQHAVGEALLQHPPGLRVVAHVGGVVPGAVGGDHVHAPVAVRIDRNLKGVLHLSSVFSESIERAELDDPRPQWVDSAAPNGTRRRQDVERQVLRGLAEQLSRHTGIRAQVLDGLALDDPRLAAVPFVLLMGNAPFEATEAEALGLARYLVAGGFVYAEVFCSPRARARGFEYDLPSLRQLFRDGLRLAGLHEGKDWRFARLEPAHPLYHCYYDFPDLPRG